MIAQDIGLPVLNSLMKYTLAPLRYLFYLTQLILSFFCHAIDSDALEKRADSSIKELYHRLNNMPKASMIDRITWISGSFLGIRYELGSLGEGSKSLYDQYPQYRVDAFDCDTYVTTVLALALANSLDTFQNCLKLTRYKQGKVNYISRNHFTSIDWNKNNEARGVLKDITLEIRNEKNQPVALIANTLINKPGWYAHKNLSTIRLQKPNESQQEKRLSELKAQGSQLEKIQVKLPYIPFTALFGAHNKPNNYLFSQIPHGAIIEIIRPNWDLRQQIGTSLDISHLGFAIRTKNQLYFRQASSDYNKVVDVPLIEYLQKAQSSPTIKGINILIIVPTKLSPSLCQLEKISA